MHRSNSCARKALFPQPIRFHKAIDMTQDTQGMTSWQPLAGIKVADFSALLPGPLSTVLLADLGADVVMVEPPGGDAARTLLPDMFRSVNRNKRSSFLDIKSTEGREPPTKIAAYLVERC